MIKKHLFILLIPFIFYSQDEQLRIETINVFKEFQPKIADSKKIGEQPIFNDTLRVNVVSNQSILNKNFKFKESILYKNPSKFRMNKINNHFQKYFSINLGVHAFLNAKFHYNNGLSVLHNSGLYLEHSSEDYGFKTPFYRNMNGELKNSIKLYSNRFLNNKLLETSCQFTRKSGLYWGGLGGFPIDSISNFIGHELNAQANLKHISNTKFLKSIHLQFNSLSNNYHRQEVLFKSSFRFEIDKALRKYSFLVSAHMSNTSLNPEWVPSSPVFEAFNPKISTAFFHDEMSDILLKSKLLISGTKFIDYKLGLDIQYSKMNNVFLLTEFDNIKSFIFPSINLFKDMNNNQRIEFLIEKDFKYHSFISLFNNISYVDPYYRNSITNEMNVSLMYNKEFAETVSFFSSINYNIVKNKLIPFLMSSDTEYTSFFTHQNSLMNPLSFYLSDFNGLVGSSSFSFSKNQCDVLMSGTINMLNSTEHVGKNIIPFIEFNSMLTVNLFDNFNISSHGYFFGERDAVRMPSVLVSNNNLTYVNIKSYFNLNISMQYVFQNMIFSFDFKNLLGHDMEFFDGYYDDEGLKFKFGFLYNF